MTQRIIGIDFGTSATVVKVKTYEDGKPTDSAVTADYVRFDNSKDTLPTLAWYDEDEGEWLFGYDAENSANNAQGELFRNFKLDLLSADGETRERAETLIGKFFGYIHEEYMRQVEHFPPCQIETTYVSYPAKWPKSLADTMKRIADKVGFKNVQGMDEPSAAIHTVLIQQEANLQKLGADTLNVLMVDMGAGTTDLAMCRYTAGQKHVEILNTWPKADGGTLFGGREVDEKLCDYVRQYLTDCGIPNTNDFDKKYLHQCKSWKESNVSLALRKPDGVQKNCGFIQMILSFCPTEPIPFPAIDRNGLENMLSGYLKQFPTLINGMIENTPGFSSEDVDLVILTGGHSQWYFAEEIINGALTSFGTVNLPKIRREPERIIKLSRPQETVALGMVYQLMNPPLVPKQDDSDAKGVAVKDKKIRGEGKSASKPIKYAHVVIDFELCTKEGIIFVDASTSNLSREYIEYIKEGLSECLQKHNTIKGLKATLVYGLEPSSNVSNDILKREIKSATKSAFASAMQKVRLSEYETEKCAYLEPSRAKEVYL